MTSWWHPHFRLDGRPDIIYSTDHLVMAGLIQAGRQLPDISAGNVLVALMRKLRWQRLKLHQLLLGCDGQNISPITVNFAVWTLQLCRHLIAPGGKRHHLRPDATAGAHFRF